MESAEKPQEKYIAQMSLRRYKDGKPIYLKARIYPVHDESDFRPFIVKDSEGNEVELSLDEQALAETLVFRKPRAETLYLLEKRRLASEKNQRRSFNKRK